MSKDKYRSVRLDNIKKTVSLRGLIDDFNISCQSEGDVTQLHCPFHGDDRHASARIYDTNTMYCWVCSKSWDVVEFVKDFKNIDFSQALSFLENKYNLEKPDVSIAYTPETLEERETPEENVERKTPIKFDDEFDRLRRYLKTYSELLNLKEYSRFYNYLDNLYADYKLGLERKDLTIEIKLLNLQKEIDSKL